MLTTGITTSITTGLTTSITTGLTTGFKTTLDGTNFILKNKVYKLIKSHEYIKGHKERREPLTIWPQVHKDIISKCSSLF